MVKGKCIFCGGTADKMIKDKVSIDRQKAPSCESCELKVKINSAFGRGDRRESLRLCKKET